MIYNGKIKDGKLHIFNRQDFAEKISQMKDGNYTITVKRKKKRRSTDQLRYYFGAMLPLIRKAFYDLGTDMSIEQLDYMFRQEFLFKEIPNKHGEILRIIQPLNELNTEATTTDMMSYFAHIQQWCAENLDLYVPSPNEDLSLNI